MQNAVPDLETFIRGADQIPPASRVLARLSLLVNDVDSTLYDIVSLLKCDMSLTSMILRISNSAIYGGSAEIGTLEDAVNRLGYREIFRIATAVAAKQLMDRDLPAYQLRAEEIFAKSLGVGLVCEHFATTGIEEAGTAYTFGLLHLIGKYQIDEHIREFKPGTVYDPEVSGLSVDAWERKTTGFDHARVGGSMLKKWDFPRTIHTPVTWQLVPLDAPYLSALCCRLAVANAVVDEVREPTCQPDDLDPEIPSAVLDNSGLNISEVRAAVEEARVDYEEIVRMLSAC